MTAPATMAAEDKPLVYLSPFRKAVATVLLMAATVVVVLDQTIATIAMPQMQAALGGTPDTISWVLTSYIMAGAVAMPMTGWLTGRFGRTRVFGVCIAIFTISSTVCGLAVSLPMMVMTRIIQGFSGAFLMPMSQAFLYDMNRPSQQVRAVSIWAMGAMMGPLLGPSLGGWLTSTFNWRWVFLINLPIGVIAAVGIFMTMPKFPSVRRPFDYVGFMMIAIGLCALQLALDRGTQEDWFASPEIIFELGLSAAFFWMAYFHLRRSDHPIIAISLFGIRNYAATMVIGFFLIGGAFGSMVQMPGLYINLLGYSVTDAGLMMVPRGIAMTIALFVGGRLMKYIDGRLQMLIGLSMTIFALWLNTGFTLQMGSDRIITSGVIEGFGSGLAITVLSYLAVSSAPVELRTEASALFNLGRNTGLSISIAICSGLLVYNTQINHAEIGAAMEQSTIRLSEMLGGANMAERVAAMANIEVTRQAMMVAYINNFWMIMWCLILMLPVLLLLTPVRLPRGAVPVAASE